MTLGAKIRKARLERRMTQEQLAGEHFSKSYISELERDRRRPRLNTLRILARRLDLPVSHFHESAPEEREGEALLQLGLARLEADTPERALEPLERAAELAMQQCDDILLARIELTLAVVDHRLGRLMRAQRRLDKCVRVLARAGAAACLVKAHMCLGRIKLDMGDSSSALWAFQAAYRLAQQLPQDPALLSALCLDLGTVHRKLGDPRAARASLQHGLTAAAALHDPCQIAARYLELSTSAVEKRRFDPACENAGKALAIYENLTLKRRLAEMHERLAELDAQDEQWEEAGHHYRWSVALNGAATNLPGAAQTLSSLAEVLLERASPDAARAMCELALDLLVGETGQVERAHALRVLGSTYRMLGRREEARAALEQSLDLCTRLHRTRDVRLARQALALLAIEDKDLAAARQHLQLMAEGSHTAADR
jgi:transcriptional regulator with XRE-family HTH domain